MHFDPLATVSNIDRLGRRCTGLALEYTSAVDGGSDRHFLPDCLQDSNVFRRGVGHANAHYGELFQGQVSDSNGSTHRCLVSLPCFDLRSVVIFEAAPGVRLTVEPPHKRKVHAATTMALDYLDALDLGGTVTVDSTIQESKGYGSSTADCIAAVRSVADALGSHLTEEEVAALVVRAEEASDNTMFQHAVLFAHREGVVLEYYAKPLPKLDVLAFDTEPKGVIDTLTYPLAQYSREESEAFDTLTAALRRAIHTQDAPLLGQVATASAALNQRFLPKLRFSDVRRIAETVGALGIAVAHSGTVLGILLNPADPKLPETVERLQADLETIGVCEIVRFRTTRHPLREKRQWPRTNKHC